MVRPLTSFQAPDVVVDVAGEIDLKVVAPVGPQGPQGPQGPAGTSLRSGVDAIDAERNGAGVPLA
jgi:hypothetical protein